MTNNDFHYWANQLMAEYERGDITYNEYVEEYGRLLEAVEDDA